MKINIIQKENGKVFMIYLITLYRVYRVIFFGGEKIGKFRYKRNNKK